MDVPGVEAQEAWDEEETYWLYIPYAEEELAQMEANKNRPSVEELLEAMVEGVENAWRQNHTSNLKRNIAINVTNIIYNWLHEGCFCPE